MWKPISKIIRGLWARDRLFGKAPGIRALAGAEAVLQNLVREGKVPGVSVLVQHQGNPALAGGYGYADLEAQIRPHHNKTLFRAASISKPITATALLKMVDEGLIHLDASFYDYVPYFPRKRYDFTIRQLASHTAGIRGYRGKEYGLNESLSIRQGLKIFQDDPLLFQPGTDYFYNSYGYVMLSLAMQEAAGIPFPKYVESRVLTPLQMHSTVPEIQSAALPWMATFYTRKVRGGFRTSIPVNNNYKLAGGGYLTTAGDIAKLGQSYLEGTIFPNPLVKEFLTPVSLGERPTNYGLGWEVSTDHENRPFYGHTGNSVGAFSLFRVYPEQDTVLVVLVNCTKPDLQTSLEQFISLVMKSVEQGTQAT